MERIWTILPFNFQKKKTYSDAKPLPMNQHERVSKTSRKVCIQTRIININERAHPFFFLEALVVVQNYSRVPDFKARPNHITRRPQPMKNLLQWHSLPLKLTEVRERTHPKFYGG